MDKRAHRYFFSTTLEQNSNLPPQFSELPSKKHIVYGETNDYADYLVELFSRASTHGAIIKGKHRYILGQGFKPNQDLPPNQLKTVEEWMKSVNEYGQSLIEVLDPAILDWLIYGGFSLMGVNDLIKSKPKNLHYKDFSNYRRALDDDQFYYSKYWVYNRVGARQSYAMMPKDAELVNRFKYGTNAKGLLYFTDSRPQFRHYPLPEYIGSIQDIETEILIAEFHNNNIKTGFSAGFIIEFTNGVPSEDEKAEVERDIKEKMTQARNAGEIFLTFSPSKERGVNVIPIRPNDMDKQFEVLRKDITQSIITNHSITSPMLMAIKTEGQLGGNNELLTAAQLFQNTYVTPKQQIIEKFVNKWFTEAYGFDAGIYIEKLKPVKEGLSLTSIMNDLTQDERRELAGLPPLTKEQKTEIETKAKENQVQKFSFNDGVEELLTELKKNAIDLDGEIVGERNCMTEEDFERVDAFEQSFQMFASVYDLPYYQGLVYQFIENNIGESYTLKQIADRLLISVQQVELALTQLQEQNYLNYKNLKNDVVGNFKINPVSDAALKENVPAWKLVTRWQYSGPNDSRTRPFCYRMLNEEGLKGKYWSRESINKLSYEEGRNVWLTRGGWYTLPNGNKRPSCRHFWKQIIVKVNESKTN